MNFSKTVPCGKLISCGLLLLTLCNCSESGSVKINVKPAAIEGLLEIKSDAAVLLSENIQKKGSSLNIRIPKPDFYQLEILPNGENKASAPTYVYLDKQEVQVEITDSPYPVVTSDSPIQKDLYRYYKQLTDERKDLLTAYGTAKYTFDNNIDRATADEAQILMTNLVTSKDSYLKSELQITRTFIESNPGSLLSAFLLSRINPEELVNDPHYYHNLFTKFDDPIKNSSYGKKAAAVTAENLNAAVGSPLHQIMGKTTGGQPFDPKQIKGKLTLIAFWRSLNNESAREIQELKDVYQKHNQDGFEIVAVSFDKTPERWKSFVQQHNLPWINLCDFEGSSSLNLKNFNNNRIPFYWLVGPDLSIMARDVRISELPIYLREHFKKTGNLTFQK